MMLKEEQIKEIAEYLNDRIDIPILTEGMELKGLMVILEILDELLTRSLPVPENVWQAIIKGVREQFDV